MALATIKFQQGLKLPILFSAAETGSPHLYVTGLCGMMLYGYYLADLKNWKMHSEHLNHKNFFLMKRTYSSQCKKSWRWLLVNNLLPKIFFRPDAGVSLFSVSLSSWQSLLECSCVHNRTPVFSRLDGMTSSTRRKDRCSVISDPTQWLWTCDCVFLGVVSSQAKGGACERDTPGKFYEYLSGCC